MRYMGGKARISKEIASIIANRKQNRTICVEPFMGGCNVTIQLAQIFDRVYAYDLREDLVLMRKALADGWIPPTEINEVDYKALRHAESSPLRGFAGTACSFGGTWFGGYARDIKNNNYAAIGCRVTKKETALMPNVVFAQGNFLENIPIVPNSVLYCDPPYASTSGYKQGKFDHDLFWNQVRVWVASGAIAFVSEQIAPDDFVSVWSKDKTKGLRSSDGSHEALKEQLFMHKSQAYTACSTDQY